MFIAFLSYQALNHFQKCAPETEEIQPFVPPSSSTLSTHSIASPGARVGQLTPGTRMYTRYARDHCTSERSLMIKNNERAALLKQKSKIEESLKRVDHELKQIVSRHLFSFSTSSLILLTIQKSEACTIKNMKEMIASLLSPIERVTLNIGNQGVAQGTTKKAKSAGSAYAPGFYLPEE